MQIEQIGKYRVLAKIGQGAMGEVYKGHDPFLNRDVAIKTISASLGADEEIRKRFLREAQAAARLNHPNIITVYDFGEEQGKIYMAMELLEGKDLKDLVGQPRSAISTASSTSWSRSPTGSPSPTRATSSTATSSPPTSTSSPPARSRSSTSASRASAPPR